MWQELRSYSKVRLEDIRNSYEIGSRIFLDVVVYIVMPPWIALRGAQFTCFTSAKSANADAPDARCEAWQESYFVSARLDANDDLVHQYKY